MHGEQALDEALALAPGTLAELSPDALVVFLQAHASSSEADLDHLADLYIAMSEGGDLGSRPQRLMHKAIAILDNLNNTNKTFDPERHTRLARLRSTS